MEHTTEGLWNICSCKIKHRPNYTDNKWDRIKPWPLGCIEHLRTHVEGRACHDPLDTLVGSIHSSAITNWFATGK